MLSDIKPKNSILIQEPYITKRGSIPCVPKSHKQIPNPINKAPYPDMPVLFKHLHLLG